MLCRAINGSVYYDIDNLGNLRMLLDAACISENMIVAIGSETLCREWCIGAITCARKKKATLQTIMSIRTFSGYLVWNNLWHVGAGSHIID